MVYKVMKEGLARDQLLKSAKLLGITQGDVMVFNNEAETNILMDFALYDFVDGDKNVIRVYTEKRGGKNDMEKEILEAWLSSHTSLFRISSVSPSEGFSLLEDLLGREVRFLFQTEPDRRLRSQV